MPILKPATPGFLTCLAATILLAIVSFSVPYFHSVFFLKASLAAENQSGDIIFGTLGYCVILNGKTTCSKPSVGYELNINELVGNKLPIQIPDVIVKWITYALVLHIVALVLAAISALFGLLAHVREMSMTCFSSCIAGFGAVVALIAFIFDIAFFFIAKSRLNAVKGGSATLGNAIWLTLGAWVLLFFSGCFYGIGRCCIRRRPRSDWDKNKNAGPESGYADQMRLDAVKAEADRKARQKRGEGGLPAFQEYDPSQPLYAKVDDEGGVHLDDEHSSYYDGPSSLHNQYNQAPSHPGGYVQGTPGHRAIDEYNAPASYPPQPHRQGSGYTQSTTAYNAPSQYGYGGSPPPAVPTPANNQYLSTAPYQDPYGHTQGGTSYHSAVDHQQFPSAQVDAYGAAAAAIHQPQHQYSGYSSPPRQPEQPFPEPNNNSLLAAAGMSGQMHSPYDSHPSPYDAHPGSQPTPERNYTLGGGAYDSGYGANQVPEHSQHTNNQFFPTPYPDHQLSASPAPINTDVAATSHAASTSPVRGPRNMGSPVHQYSDSPPGYDNGHSQPPGAWGEKH